MKKVLPFLLLMFVLATSITSCKKDKEVLPETSVEKWFFERGVYEEYDPSGVLLETQTDSAWTVNDYFALATDGRFELVQNGRILVGTYLIEKSIMTLTYQQSNGSSVQTVSLTATVLEKTTSKFTFYVEEIEATSKFKTTIYLKK